MSAIFTGLQNIWKKNPYLVSFVALILIAPLLFFAVATPVRTGTKTQCKYNHLIKDDTHLKIVWRYGAGNYKVKTIKSICDRHKKLEALLWQAKTAKKQGDTGRANRLAAEIKKIDPTFQPAAVAAITGSAANSGATNGTTPGTTDPGTTPGEKPVFSGELAAAFPKSLAGYTQVIDSPGSLTASRMYEADKTAHPKVSFLTIQVIQTGTVASGLAYIGNSVKTSYADSGKDVTVNGEKGYFGTDGGSLAILAYPVDSIVIELELSAASGSAADLYDDLIALSKLVH